MLVARCLTLAEATPYLTLEIFGPITQSGFSADVEDFQVASNGSLFYVAVLD